MAIPIYLWLIDDVGSPVNGSVDIKGREGSIEVIEFMHAVELPVDDLTGKITGPGYCFKWVHNCKFFRKKSNFSQS